MSLITKIKNDLNAARKSRDATRLSILGVALGEMQTVESRGGKPMADDAALKIIRRIVEGNSETMSRASDQATQGVLVAENEILSAYLPQAASADEVEAELLNSDGPEVEELQAKATLGQATGVAMRFFKSRNMEAFGKKVDGRVVARVVEKMYYEPFGDVPRDGAGSDPPADDSEA